MPGIFPIDPQWRFVLFGFTAIQFARHPEGMLEFGKRRATAKRNERLWAREILPLIEDYFDGDPSRAARYRLSHLLDHVDKSLDDGDVE